MKSSIVAFWLALIILASSWSLFRPGIFYLHDYLHVARIGEMATALKDGHFPVRWSQNFGYGFGMPLFEFYGPLPYYLGAVFFLVGIPAITSFKLLMLLANFATALGSFKLGKQIYGRAGGLLVAAAVTLAPYRAVDLFVRGALSEVWGIMAIVWICYYLWQTLKGVSKSWLGLTASLSVLFLSHNVLTLLFLPFSLLLGVLFLVFQWLDYGKEKNKPNFPLLQRLLTVSFSYLGAVSVSAFYLFPALIEKNLTKVEETVTGGYFDYTIHFVYVRQFFSDSWGYGGSSWGPTDGISFYLGLGQLILILFGVLGLGYLILRMKQHQVSWKRIVLFSGIYFLMGAALLMTTGRSAAVWQSSSLLQFAQFPWRFLAISCVLIGLVSPISLYLFNSKLKQWLFAWLLLLTFFVNARYFRPESQLIQPEQYYTTNPMQISQDLSSVLPDYLPSTFPDQPPEMLTLAACEQGCEQLETKINKTQEKSFSVWSSVATTVTAHVSYYPGWQVLVNDQVVPSINAQGLLAARIPEGQSTVRMQLVGTPIRIWSDRISLVGLVSIALVLLVPRLVTKRNSSDVSR